MTRYVAVRDLIVVFLTSSIREAVISLLSQVFVTWNIVNHNKFTKASHAFLTCYVTKFTNCMHERGRIACQELLSGISPWL